MTDSRITLDSSKRGGRPCIRNLRISVYDVLEMLADGMSEEDIIEDFPELEPADIRLPRLRGRSRTQSVYRGRVMKLLLDENLSRRIVPFLQTAFPGSTQSPCWDWRAQAIPKSGCMQKTMVS